MKEEIEGNFARKRQLAPVVRGHLTVRVQGAGWSGALLLCWNVRRREGSGNTYPSVCADVHLEAVVLAEGLVTVGALVGTLTYNGGRRRSSV